MIEFLIMFIILSIGVGLIASFVILVSNFREPYNIICAVGGLTFIAAICEVLK